RGAVELARAGHHAITGVRLAHRGAIERFTLGLDHRTDLKAELTCELEVTLIVSRHGHYHAGAVTKQHVIGDPDGHALAIHGIQGVRAREYTRFFLAVRLPLDLALA